MNFLKKLLASLVFLASFTTPAFASVTQGPPPSDYSSWFGWNAHVLGSVTFANNTNHILDLTSAAWVADQGWGFQDPNSNHVYLALFDNGTNIWDQHVAGAVHGWTHQSFDIADHAAALTSLNDIMANYDWSLGHTLQMRMVASSVGWLGWQLHVRNASFSVTSAVVPEPGSLALLGLGLFGFLVSRRKFAQ